MSLKAKGVAFALAGVCSALSACTTVPADCDRGGVRLTQSFSGAPAYACTRTGPSAFRLEVTPESAPINPSPWYAFDLEARRPSEITVELAYGEYWHRYRPKLDRGDGIWVELPESSVNIGADGRVATFNVSIAPGSSRIAAQEVFGIEERAEWRAGFAARAGLSRQTIGQSIEGRTIEALSRPASIPGAPLIVILGGQHPPEVPGVLGLRAFLETLFVQTRSGSGLDHFEWLIVPDLNPDGVERGHWRHNSGGTDLNRDWGPFNQPETTAVRAELEARQRQGHAPFLLLDFHSTHRDVLYTPPDELELLPDDFASDWITILDHIWPGPGEAFDRSAGHNPDTPTAKTWFAATYGAPGLTVEFGDETDRGRITLLAQTAATALRTYLDDVHRSDSAGAGSSANNLTRLVSRPGLEPGTY